MQYFKSFIFGGGWGYYFRWI